MRIALVQQQAGHDRNDNLARGLAALARAASEGAELICFAELAFERFYPQVPAGDGVADLAEPVPGPTKSPSVTTGTIRSTCAPSPWQAPSWW
jgi:N-carbamoylputrescine amidase